MVHTLSHHPMDNLLVMFLEERILFYDTLLTYPLRNVLKDNRPNMERLPA